MSEFIRYQGRELMRVHCLVPSCPQVLVKRVGLWKRRLVKTEHYAELVLEMREPNGQLSKHEAVTCKRCLRRLWQHGPMEGELDLLYARDVEQQIATALRMGIAPAEVAWRGAQMAARTPVRVLHERGRGDQG